MNLRKKWQLVMVGKTSEYPLRLFRFRSYQRAHDYMNKLNSIYIDGDHTYIEIREL